jgi:hypothetical protein
MQSESALQQIVAIHGSINYVIISLYFLLELPYRLKRLKEYSSLIFFSRIYFIPTVEEATKCNYNDIQVILDLLHTLSISCSILVGCVVILFNLMCLNFVRKANGSHIG